MKYLSVLLLALALSACSSATSGISIESSNQNVVIGNSSLASRITIEKALISDANGLMKAGVPVTSMVNSDMKLQYRFYWYDAQGLEVDGSNSPWRQFVLHGKDSMTLQAVAKKSSATQYRIYIREADY
ncbi:YcfL family protein [Photobacterium sp. SDRW27]|uniref:YcfL family protein n=1 Tax=Photobacterium obscurum TaxID=2829490 RepID=UPI002242CF53|nr:YcfL family protein [Photobacterium obscurum]MCW8327295.1 YcfL family protein [Photobacterium obscurum]